MPTYSSFITERDDVNYLEYIQINNFDNYGGQISYAKDYVYPELYHEDDRITFDWKVLKTELNEKMTEMFSVKLRYSVGKNVN